MIIRGIQALSLLLLQLLRLASHEVLSQLVVTIATFKSFQQVLAIDVLDNRPLLHYHHGVIEALENTIATRIILVHVDNGFRLLEIATFYTCSDLFSVS